MTTGSCWRAREGGVIVRPLSARTEPDGPHSIHSRANSRVIKTRLSHQYPQAPHNQWQQNNDVRPSGLREHKLAIQR
jgi:hypothetical protein